MKNVGYLKRAKKKFLHGTRFRSPVEAVEAGIRSLEEWADTVSHERDSETSTGLRSNARVQQLDIARA